MQVGPVGKTCILQDKLCFLGSNNLAIVLHAVIDNFQGGLKNKSDVLYLTYCKDRQLAKHLSNRLLFKFYFHAVSSYLPSLIPVLNRAINFFTYFCPSNMASPQSVFYLAAGMTFLRRLPRVFGIKQFKFHRREMRILSKSGNSVWFNKAAPGLTSQFGNYWQCSFLINKLGQYLLLRVVARIK